MAARNRASARRHATGIVCLAGLLWLSVARPDGFPDEPPPAASEEQRAVEELDLGRRVFHRKCKKCHGSGREGAPVVGRPGEWVRRLDQPPEALIEHALRGHRGSRGRMPPKGDFDTLGDAEVTAAVRFMIARGEWLRGEMEKRRVACMARPGGPSCVPADPGDVLLLEMLWRLGSTPN